MRPEAERWREGRGGGQIFCQDTHHTPKLVENTEFLYEEAIFLVHASPWETEFMNTAFGIPEMPGQEREPPKRVAQVSLKVTTFKCFLRLNIVTLCKFYVDL
jgi:hypothetical protein